MNDGPVSGWGVYENAEGTELNIIPENDVKMHLYGKLCGCRPTKEVSESGVPIYVHNSYDGREPYETGAKKPH